MIRKIGKYEVRERIGRGGMGMVFKAHDPVLDRAVAIKVISDDVDVTEELRARFFREAQACAKLSHPNIVTIYDMGEEDGRLYIVMEFLEGEELRHLIAQRRYTALEDKISLMSQVCDGLHYAHQKGVIHRDIKPGNIIVLRDGVAKIVDFGIAHVATLGASLTRTGLVMGTLRYISPEQARGRADHRSDMFSVGSVFYEFLALRPALTGADPMHLLEQLRSEEPPALAEVDPTIPLDLSAVIAKAMRKDPAERFVDLGQMRLELDNVQLRLGNDAAEIRRSIMRKLERARQLQTVLAERLGASASTVDLPVVEERARLDTLRALDGEMAERTQRLQQLLDRAERVSPVLERGLAHLDARRFQEAIGDLEEVLGELPEHAAAAAALQQARQGAEKERRRRLVAGRLEQASAAFERGAYRVCLEIVTDVLDEARELELGDEASGLRRAVEAEIAAQEVAEREEMQRQRDRAESAMTLLEEARGGAFDVDAARRAERAWLDAESKAAEGRAALDRGAHVLAAEAFDEAAILYHRAEESARESIRQEELQRQRAQAERALQRMAQRQSVAQAIQAERWSDDLWSKAAQKARDGRAALEQEAFFRAIEAFEEATALFRRAEEVARDAIKKEETERKRVEVEQVRAASRQAREVARAAEAQIRAPSLWQAAESREAAAQQAVSESAYTQATRLFGEAADLYADGERAAQTARRQEQEQAQQALDRVAGWRNQAETARAADLAETLWRSAEAKAVDGKAAVSTENYGLAVERLLEAEGFYRRAVQAAQALRRQQKDEATGAQELTFQQRAAAARLDAAARSADLWQRAEGRMAEAESALSQGEYAPAKEAFSEAGELFGQAERAARDAVQREELARDRHRAQRAETAVNARRAAAEEAEAARRAASPWVAARDKAEVARHAFDEARYGEALAAFEQAATLYREAEESARGAMGQEALARQREAAESAGQAMAAAKATASDVDAATRATADWREAEAKSAEGRAALARAEYERATRAFEEAVPLYGHAERIAREAMRAEQARHQQRLAEQARDLMARRRGLAADANAGAAAAATWAAAVATAEDGQRAIERGDYTEAARAFTTASGLFREAEDVARRAMATLDRAPAGQVPHAGGDESTILVDRVPLDERLLEARSPGDLTELIPDEDKTSAVPVPGVAEKTPPIDVTPVARSTTVSDSVRAGGSEQGVLPLPSGDGTGVAEGSSAPGRRATTAVPEQVHAQHRSVARPGGSRILVAGVAVVVLLVTVSVWLLLRSGDASKVAEEGREGARVARIEAEKLAAPKNAAENWDRARRLEAEAEQAFGRRDYDGAARSFASARTSYTDAKTAAERLRADAALERTKVADAHKAAIEAKAPERAKAPYDEAVGKERDAETLMNRQEFGPAQRAFADASRRFEVAASRASAFAPPPENLAPATGSVLITANVAGAEVWVGKERTRIRTQAVEVGPLSAGRHPVKATREGYKEWTGQVEVVAGGRVQLAIALERVPVPEAPRPTTGSVFISANVAGAEVSIGGERIQTRAQGVEVGPLSAGRHPVKATREGYKEWTGQVEVVAGGRVQLAIALERVPVPEAPRPTTGSVFISANVAGAEVSIGGERIQTRAQGVEVGPLSAGRHPVKATREGYKEWTGQVEVVAGGRVQLAIALERVPVPEAPRPTTGSVFISANVAGAEVSIGGERIQTRAQGVEVGPLSPGRHPVKATREGYKEWTGQVEVVAGGRVQLAIALERVPDPPPRPTTGSVFISANVAGAEVWVGDHKIKSETQGVEVGPLSPGQYPVKASRAGYKSWTGRIEVVAGGRAELKISLERTSFPVAP